MCTILEMLNALSMETSHFAKIYLTSVSLAFPSLISNTAKFSESKALSKNKVYEASTTRQSSTIALRQIVN